jgi:hypothetical protein
MHRVRERDYTQGELLMIIIEISKDKFVELEKTLLPIERFIEDIEESNIVIPIGNWREKIIFKII